MLLGDRLSPLVNFQSRAERVVFSIGSPTMVPSSSRTSAWAAARARVVSFLVLVTSTSSRGLLELHGQTPTTDILEEKTHFTPATPSTTRSSPVMVPVLSKQQTSTRPANGIRKGSVQKMAENQLHSSPGDVVADHISAMRPKKHLQREKAPLAIQAGRPR